MGDFHGAADASQEVGKSMALGMGYVTWSAGPKSRVLHEQASLENFQCCCQL